MALSMMVFLQEPDGPASAISWVRRPDTSPAVRHRVIVEDRQMKAHVTYHDFHR